MNFTDDFQLDAFGTNIVYDAAPSDWLTLLDSNLKVIHQDFYNEDQEGYSNLVKRLRAWTWCHKVPKDHRDYVSIDQIAEIAASIRAEAKVLVTVGIGGSDLGARTLHDLLNHPYHNEMVVAGKITGIPEIHFTGDTFDPFRLRGLLTMLKTRNLLDQTVINIVSKSGTTAETALAGMILADAIGSDWMSRTVATTGLSPKSLLYQLQEKGDGKFMAILPVPDGVGGRFSFASPVGLLLLAVTADSDPQTRLRDAFEGYTKTHEAFLTLAPEKNPAYQIARFLHAAEVFCRKSALVFYPYFDNKKLGDWFVQLYEESVQERGSGLNILATTGPTGNHSLLNGIVNGARDKAVLFLTPRDFGDVMAVPEDAPLEGSLKIFQGLTLAAAQTASLRGTAEDFISRMVPTATLSFPKRDTSSIFALMRLLMDVVAVKGRLQSLHLDPISGKRRIADEETYIQNGVEGYKIRMRDNIKK
ncbi:MAG: hypothetical protein C4527_25045 [Candidatus Omnitrophota bacterium]|jgi:glucose-6-phosphate isomerase|nr:MAG: hypothetical protein C4527_25045 [Candidatus Omnitrophota bacterium]